MSTSKEYELVGTSWEMPIDDPDYDLTPFTLWDLFEPFLAMAAWFLFSFITIIAILFVFHCAKNGWEIGVKFGEKKFAGNATKSAQ